MNRSRSVLSASVGIFLPLVLSRVSDLNIFFGGVHVASVERSLDEGVGTF